jgi:hypothetical protein
MNVEHDVRASEHEVLVAALKLSAAEILSGKMACLNSRTSRAIEHEDALAQNFL